VSDLVDVPLVSPADNTAAGAASPDLAGAVITVMLATGRALESRASARARRDMRALVERAPHIAHRLDGDMLVTRSVDEVLVGDLLVVKPGEVVPVDGRVEEPAAVVDESTLTGEALPVQRAAGDAVCSGTGNVGGAFTMRATSRAMDSTYAGIARLVAEADASSAPFVRLADRYAAVFLTVTLALAALAWALSGDPVRAVAVLVVATPCPLILAAPVAIVCGLSRAAGRGGIIRGGGALERLADGDVLLLDKTGTITTGRPTVTEVRAVGRWDVAEILTAAPSLDQISPHVLASAIVRAAHDRGLSLVLPSDVVEVPGEGIRGTVGGRATALGRARWVAPHHDPRWSRPIRRQADLTAGLTVFVAVSASSRIYRSGHPQAAPRRPATR
jgi:cation transport ATPase